MAQRGLTIPEEATPSGSNNETDTTSSPTNRTIDPNNIVTTGPYAGLPVLPPGMVWTKFPMDGRFLEDQVWYDGLGIDLMDQREVYDIKDEEELHKVLKEILTECPHRGMNMMFNAAVKGRADIIKWALGQGVRPHPIEEEGDEMSCVPIQAASFQGHLDCVRMLVEHGNVSVNAVDEQGGTPLMRAATGKHFDIMRYLLDKGASLTMKQKTDDGDFNALETSSIQGDLEGIEMLFQAYSKEVVAEGKEEKSIVTSLAVQGAANSGNPEALEYFLRKGGFPMDADAEPGSWKGDRLDDDQRKTIKLAMSSAINTKADQVRILLSYLAPLDDSGRVPYISNDTYLKERAYLIALSSMKRGDLEAFELVWTALENPKEQTILFGEGQTLSKQEILDRLFNQAVRGGHLDAIKRAVQLGADVRTAAGLSFSPALYTAAAFNHVDAIEYLLEEHDCDIDMAGGKFSNGPTPLAIAILEGHKDAARLLLKHGGPVEQIKHLVSPESTKKLVLSAAHVYRQDVQVVFADADHEAKDRWATLKGIMVLDISENDNAWLDKIRQRKGDEELASADVHKRELRKPDASSDSS